MLIAKHEEAATSVAGIMRRLRATHEQFVEANPDSYLIPEHEPGDWVQNSLLVAYILMAAALLGSLMAAAKEAYVLSAVCAVTAVLMWLYQRARVARDRRLCREDNQKVRIGLGALVQANADLFESDNDHWRWGYMVVAVGTEFDDRSDELIEFASELYGMKVHELETPSELSELVSEVREEMPQFPKRHVIPSQFVGPGEVWALDVQVIPAGLPHGYLHQRLWPVIFHEEDAQIPFRPVPKARWWHAEYDALLASAMPWDE